MVLYGQNHRVAEGGREGGRERSGREREGREGKKGQVDYITR